MPTDSSVQEGLWTTFSGAGALAAVLLTLLGYFCWRQILHALGFPGVRTADEESGELLDRELRFECERRQIEEAFRREPASSSRATDLTELLNVVLAQAALLRKGRRFRR
ncbi:MAG: hypothetical protein Q9170_000001, partial [Blastenia crenularia]